MPLRVPFASDIQLLWYVCFSFAFSLNSDGENGLMFTNPVVAHGADPWVIRWQTNYYFCQSRSDSVWVNRASRLEDIGKDHWKRVWKPARGTTYSKEIWAPELHFLQGKWYIYLAADDGDNANHRMYVLEGTSSDPQSPYVFKGMIASSSNRWADRKS